MKVLIDTSVWSLSLRRKGKTALSDDERRMVGLLADIIQDGRVSIIGPIRQELLSGVKEPDQFERLRSALAAFPDESITAFHYLEAARLYNICRSRGVECGPVDILICAVAAANQWSILTNDSGMKRCIDALRAAGLTL